MKGSKNDFSFHICLPKSYTFVLWLDHIIDNKRVSGQAVLEFVLLFNN